MTCVRRACDACVRVCSYSKYSLQHSRSTETSCSSLSISELQPPSSGLTTRQNSAENKSTDPISDALNQFTQRFEKLSKEIEGAESGWSRVGALAAAGACPCWCARWAELHVRSPTGDVSWLLRMQNRISSSQLQDWPLQDVLALLAPPLADLPPDLQPHLQPHLPPDRVPLIFILHSV
ncbi:unnamed protein product [Euphydryas editha]|uniref:Uncharacterized protein n=1 Tax=Euphydryas editha TaxID=104508 RepID=A0AAU9V9S2_EUPED|nr:unnamed protein product [Euphydryas editha]